MDFVDKNMGAKVELVRLQPAPAAPWVQGTGRPPQTLTSRHDAAESFEVPQHEAAAGDITIFLTGKSAHVQEFREIEIDENGHALVTDLPAPPAFDPATVEFLSLTDPKARVLEQQYWHDARSQARLLQKTEGQTVTVTAPRRGDQHTLSFPAAGSLAGTVSYDGHSSSYALHDADAKTAHFLQLGEGVSFHLDTPIKPLFASSTLKWRFAKDIETKKHLVRLAYLCDQSLEWTAEYTGILNAKEVSLVTFLL